jgi:hypothetical protein
MHTNEALVKEFTQLNQSNSVVTFIYLTWFFVRMQVCKNLDKWLNDSASEWKKIISYQVIKLGIH